MDTTKNVRMLLEILGCPLTGKIKKRYFFAIALSIFVLIGSTVSMVTRWSDMKSRLLAFEDLIIAFDISAIFIDFALFPRKAITIMNVIERKLFVVKYYLSTEQNNMLESLHNTSKKSMKIIFTTIFVYSFANCVVPILTSFMLIWNTGFDYDQFNSLPLAFEIWVPYPIRTFHVYYFLVILQTVYVTLEGIIFACWNLLTICAYLTVQKELSILSQSFNEIDSRVSKLYDEYRPAIDISGNYDKSDVGVDDSLNYDKIKEVILNNFLKELISHHQSIIT